MNDDINTQAPALWFAEAEQGIIGAILNAQDARPYSIASKLIETRHFYAGAHRKIWAIFAALTSRGMPTDVFSVLEAAGASAEDFGGLVYLTQLLQSAPSASPKMLKSWCGIVKDKAALRALLALADKIKTDALSDRAAPGDVISGATTALAALSRGQTSQEPQHLGELMAKRTEHYERIERGEVHQGQPLGFPSLERMIGGWADGCLYFVAARPAVGKSALALQCMLECAATGAPWLFLSQEMPSAQVADRAISHLGRVSRGRARAGKLSDDDWARIAEAVDVGMRLPIYVDDEAALTHEAVRAKAESIPGLRGIVVDYLQLMATAEKKGNRNAEIEEISRNLKRLAKDLNLPVIALSQLNRAVDGRADKKPVMSDLRDSGSIEADADGVIFLYLAEEGQRGEDGERIENDLLGIINAKARDGDTGEFFVEFDKPNQRMTESFRTPRAQESKKHYGGLR